MSAGPLRVVVTRDEHIDGPLHTALLARGLEPVACSVVHEAQAPEPEALERVASSIERYDWLVVASRRAVSALMAARGGEPLPPALRTAAVGERTAVFLVAAGALVPLTAASAGAAALIEVLRDADRWRGRRTLLPRALEGGRELAEALRNWGATVDEVVAYRTVARPRDEIAAAWQDARADAVVVASPSAARALVDAVGAASLRRLVRVAAMGASTAMQLLALGVPASVPARSDFDSVAELLLGGAGQEA
jgi:uroporphyrinogen III methyltransferase/synthase